MAYCWNILSASAGLFTECDAHAPEWRSVGLHLLLTVNELRRRGVGASAPVLGPRGVLPLRPQPLQRALYN